MKKQLTTTILVFLIFAFGCQQSKTYFNGTISEFILPLNKDSLQGMKIQLSSACTGAMSAYDTLLIFNSTKFPKGFVRIFGLNTGNSLGDYCEKGEGPLEFQGVTYRDWYSLEENKLSIWINDVNKQRLSEFNISRSIESGRTIIDSIIPLKWRGTWGIPPSFVFRVSGNEAVIKSFPKSLSIHGDDNYLPGEYYSYNLPTQKEMKKMTLFTDPLLPEEKRTKEVFSYSSYLYSYDEMSPDATQIAMAMEMLPQINILDLKTGKLAGFKIKGGAGFENIEKDKPEMLKIYYTDISASRRCIFALYLNRLVKDIVTRETNEVHVFDWSGNIKKIVVLDHKVDQIAFDPVRNLLYGKNDADNIFCYNINQIP